MSQNPHYTQYHPKWYRFRIPIFWWIHKWVHVKFILREMIKDTYPLELQQKPKSGFNLEYNIFPGTEVTFNNPFCIPRKIHADELFGQYHFMMLSYLSRLAT